MIKHERFESDPILVGRPLGRQNAGTCAHPTKIDDRVFSSPENFILSQGDAACLSENMAMSVLFFISMHRVER